MQRRRADKPGVRRKGQGRWVRASSGSVQQIDHTAAGLARSGHGFFGKGEGSILAAELQLAIDIQIPGPALGVGTLEFYPDQLIAIPE
ncbi:hypothetical protein Hsero_2317 [Herbaspirillum seropedicae SmR1]|uniref:Uncharacterized protein n=1 Tax=Herbaspirillum seropedicae (strain SmR1) TaxID=757424 RepID=D8IV77_HERSS|nr:hypothetical protein Hsero_2317 [Herbaspirillum seropedicae SmR1]